MSKQERRDFRFFHTHAGYIVGQRAICAWNLVKAEQFAEANGFQFEWLWDYSADRGPIDWGWSEADCERFYYYRDSYGEKREREHEVLVCFLKNAEGEIINSLGGIWDASREYVRVVQAEMAYGAMLEYERQQPTFGIRG